MKQTIAIEIDTDKLRSCSDSYLAQLWHVAQANPACIEDKTAGDLVEFVGREIIRRFVSKTAPELWNHQGKHHYWNMLQEHGEWKEGVWSPTLGVQPGSGLTTG